LEAFSWLSTNQKSPQKGGKIRAFVELFYKPSNSTHLCLEVMYIWLLWWILNFILSLTNPEKSYLVYSKFMDFFDATVCLTSSKEDVSLSSLSRMYGLDIPLMNIKLYASFCISWKVCIYFWSFSWLLQWCIITSFSLS
jgi:hypothetical protein